MWRTAWHKKNDEYLAFIKGRAEDPLLERIVKLEVDLKEADKIILDLLPNPGSSGCSTPAIFRRSATASSGRDEPPLSELSDIFRDAAMGEEAKPEVARPSPKCQRSEDGSQEPNGHMGNPGPSSTSDPGPKRARRVAPPGVPRRPVRMRHTAVPRSAPFKFS